MQWLEVTIRTASGGVELLCAELSEAGFALRGGFHCAYPAHRKIGTSEQGAVRFSPSVFSTAAEVMALVKAVGKIAAKSQ